MIIWLSENVRAIVTGAARGLGAATAARLVQDGCGVALIDIRPEVNAEAERLAQLATDVLVLGVVADVSDETACEDAVARAIGVLGGVDVLVNNAGIGGPDATVVETSLTEFRRVLDVNLTGTFLAARAVARQMIAQGNGGAIVNIGSIFGQQGVARGAGYCASKAGVALLTHSLSLELAPHRIRVNTIAPGNMATDMMWADLRVIAAATGTSFDDQLQRLRDTVPLDRLGTGQDVAGAVAWLISPDADYVTGQTIGVNGGVLLT
jgi:NAD(P)-dependent dehydrogenase (short-subunit alcohol dehydrogenase family)